MPLVTSPNRGYADWQRVENWDGGVVYSQPSHVMNVADDSGVIDVSRYGYIAGLDQFTAGLAQVKWTWYADAAGTIQVGQRYYTMDGNASASSQLRIPNMGPYVRYQASSFGAAATHSVSIFPTNRYHPCEFIPLDTSSFGQQGQVVVGGGGTVTVWYAYLFAGPAKLYINLSVAGSVYARIRAYDNGGLNNSIWQVSPSAGDNVYDLVLPIGSWSFQILNNNASNSTAFWSIIPSMTCST